MPNAIQYMISSVCVRNDYTLWQAYKEQVSVPAYLSLITDCPL